MDSFLTDKTVTFEQLLKGDGNGYIYDCDIEIWLGVLLNDKKREEIKKQLYKVKEILK